MTSKRRQKLVFNEQVLQFGHSFFLYNYPNLGDHIGMKKLKANKTIYWVNFFGCLLVTNNPAELPILCKMMKTEVQQQEA
ncbi:hypothetical protein F8M41_011839 [Gigaspora margarita]|uniref:Uncharacterized protein n=1 Tax=Gigaspora margarita TaxID=4874 RepID=A0A8H3WYP3_GIGMA|nr:hypothetical protein F8M41_011839 [Gigaspora margarita]